MLTEMRFRGLLWRVCEVAYALISIYVYGREPALTLGTSQVSLTYWRKQFGNQTVKLLLATFDDIENYKVCCAYLQSKKNATIDEKIVYYNLRPSVVYVKNFYANLAFLSRVLDDERMELKRRNRQGV